MIYAIDFGTTNSLLGAAVPERLFAPIPLDQRAGDPTVLRSVLFFPNRKQVFYGSEAVQEFVKHGMEGRLIRSIKKFLPIRSFIGTHIEDRPMNLEDIIAVFLAEMKRRADAHFQADVDSVVLGRPAKFTDDETNDAFAQYRLERAARIAGFKHIRFCPEPLAAALAFKRNLVEPKTVLVADFGGGTSDFTVIRMSREPYKKSDVLSIGGVPLAGDALESNVMRKRIAHQFGLDVKYQVPFGSNILTMPIHLIQKICSPADISLLLRRDTMEFFKNVRTWSLGDVDREMMDRLFCLIEEQLGFDLFEEIERTKRALSEREQEVFSFHRSDIDIDEKISRTEFEEYTEETVSRILNCLDETLKSAGLRADQIDAVCSTGGTAQVAVIREGLIKRFGSEKIQQHQHFHSIVHGLTEMAFQTSVE